MFVPLLVLFFLLGQLDACIKDNNERYCCDSVPVGECPDVDCTCENPDPIFCIFGCNSVYASKCKDCYVPPPPPPTTEPPATTAPPMPNICLIGGVYCNFDFCCPAPNCVTSSKCAAGTTTTAPTTTATATTTSTTASTTTTTAATTTTTAATTTTTAATTTTTAATTTTTAATTTTTAATTTTTAATTTTTATTSTTTTPTTTTTAQTTTTTASTSAAPRCAYNDYLTSVRLLGGTSATNCSEAPGYVSIKLAFDPTTDPLPFCGGILVAENQIQTSEFCVAQLGQLPAGLATVEVYDFNNNKISEITDWTATEGVLTLDTPVIFSAANCLLPACLVDDTSVLDLSACKMYGSGAVNAATLESDGTYVTPISITGSCASSPNWCTDPASTVQTCVGDQGGPLICPDNTGQYLVAGLISEEDSPDPCYGPPEFMGFQPLP